MTHKILRWGILSTANIAREWIIPALQKSPYAQLAGVASRDLSRAESFAKEHGFEKTFGSYDALLADPSIDVIYNPLPNNLHVPYSMQALESGKHVLCEKPLGMSADDIRPLVELAHTRKDQYLLEAFMYRFHPQWACLADLIESGEIGELQAVEASFSYFNRDANNIRHKPGVGGGGLLDVGAYCISAARQVFKREPVRVLAAMDLDPDFKVDRHVSGILDFGPQCARFFVSTQAASSQAFVVYGSKARIVLDSPFYGVSRDCKITISGENGERSIFLPDCNHYERQIEHFSRAVLHGERRVDINDALHNMKTLDALLGSAQSDKWQRL
ncbi:MAG: putative dehydrogenase [Flavobacteriales bacterium]|jgi:predicted dehydrogenase